MLVKLSIVSLFMFAVGCGECEDANLDFRKINVCYQPNDGLINVTGEADATDPNMRVWVFNDGDGTGARLKNHNGSNDGASDSFGRFHIVVDGQLGDIVSVYAYPDCSAIEQATKAVFHVDSACER